MPHRPLPLLFLLSLALGACSQELDVRVLGPSATDDLRIALRAGQFEVKQLVVDRSVVTAKLCQQNQEHCFDLKLSDPHLACADRVGPWCVAWKGDPPEDSATASVMTALGTMPDSIWFQPTVDARSAAEKQQALRNRVKADLTAIALIVVPLCVGLLLGRLLPRTFSRKARLALAAALMILPGLLVRSLPVGFWDLFELAALLALGLLVQGRSSWRKLGLTVASAAIALLVLELLVRHFLPEPRAYPPPETAHFVIPANIDDACRAIDVSAGPFWSQWGNASPSEGPVVMLGDSMIAGVGHMGVEPHELATAQLGRLDPAHSYLNAGIPAVSTDVEFLMLTTVLRHVHPSRVVLTFFTDNDIEEMDQPRACTGSRPVLTYGESGISPSTPHVTPSVFSGLMLVRRSPSPFPLRVATSFSWLARRIVPLFDLAFPKPIPEDLAWRHLELILRTIRDTLVKEHVPLAIVVLPDRQLLESSHPEDDPHWSVRLRATRLARSLGILTLDPWDELRQAVQRDGIARYFPPGDFHFNAEGNRHYAQWLLGSLGPGLSNTTATPTPF